MSVGQSDWFGWLLLLLLLVVVTHQATINAILVRHQAAQDTDPKISFYSDQWH